MRLMEALNTVEVLRHCVASWADEAQALREEADQVERESAAFRERLEAAIAALPQVDCPFCGGVMIDTTSLRPFAAALSKDDWRYLDQGEPFLLHCTRCRTYRIDAPRESAQQWEPHQVDHASAIFANDIFAAFPECSAVALERPANRWCVCLKQTWYANGKRIDELAELWGIVRRRGRRPARAR